MEVKVYEVTLDIECEQTDMDCCPYWGWETRYEDTFSTKKSAIKICQSKFDKQTVNSYVRSVHAEVREMTITETGITSVKRVYNKFKRNG